MQELVDFINQLSVVEIVATFIVLFVISYFISDRIISKNIHKTELVSVEDAGLSISQPGSNEVETLASDEDNSPSTKGFTKINDLLLYIYDNKNSINKPDIILLLKEAQSLSESPKEKVKLSVIIKKYENSINLSLDEIFDTYFKEIVSKQKLDSKIIETDEIKINNSETKPINVSKTVNDLEDKEKPIDLMSQLSVVNNNYGQVPNLPQINIQCNDVWANYMCFENGRMGLKNTFFHLENEWGTIASIAELQDKISQEIGLDANDQPKEWVMVSVIPFGSPK